jgi:hypothetical protein
LFEEIKPTMVVPLKGTDSFAKAELANGDIICVQKPPPGNAANLPRPLAPAHYAWMLNRYRTAPTHHGSTANRLSLSLSLSLALWSLT